MADYRFERECRTPYSEAYAIFDGETAVARVDLHYTASIVHGSLVVVESLTQEDIRELIEAVDEEIVMSADSTCEDFVVVVHQGREVGTYSAQDLEDEEGDGEEEPEEKPGW